MERALGRQKLRHQQAETERVDGPCQPEGVASTVITADGSQVSSWRVISGLQPANEVDHFNRLDLPGCRLGALQSCQGARGLNMSELVALQSNGWRLPGF